MVRPICKDTIFLSQKSEPATKADAAVVKDNKPVGYACNVIHAVADDNNGRAGLFAVGFHEQRRECAPADFNIRSMKRKRAVSRCQEYGERNATIISR